MTQYRKSRIRNAATKLKQEVMADGKIDVSDAKTIQAFIRPLVEEAAVFRDFDEMIGEMTKDGVVDFDEQVMILKIVNRILAYLGKDADIGL